MITGHQQTGCSKYLRYLQQRCQLHPTTYLYRLQYFLVHRF
uniref:Uncharacterized protein n=1 Tax=Podoviridae sp. ctG4L18 TaxID=2825234 RepID=A0A8S5UP24_9CAUD|nr:MAG TPA: hypothetical protein [Podoviridae sp. ctG4L18]